MMLPAQRRLAGAQHLADLSHVHVIISQLLSLFQIYDSLFSCVVIHSMCPCVARPTRNNTLKTCDSKYVCPFEIEDETRSVEGCSHSGGLNHLAKLFKWITAVFYIRGELRARYCCRSSCYDIAILKSVASLKNNVVQHSIFSKNRMSVPPRTSAIIRGSTWMNVLDMWIIIILDEPA